MFCLHAYPHAILHIDADAFFASCEQAMHPQLRGKPLVCGGERGIATAVSYEARILGVTRGMPIFEVRRQFPQVIVRESDYETYSLFSKRMYVIVRAYTGMLEEYSIDECFADITGLCGSLCISYGDIALRIQTEIERALGISVSVGVAPREIIVMLKTQEFVSGGLKARMICATNFPIELLSWVKTLFEKVWRNGTRYRATGIVLMDFAPRSYAQMTLFEKTARFEKLQRVYEAVDTLSKKAGTSVIHSGAHMHIQTQRKGLSQALHVGNYLGAMYPLSSAILPILHISGIEI